MKHSPHLSAHLDSMLVQPTDSTHWGCRLDRSASWRKEPVPHIQEAYIASRWGLKAAKELIVPTSVENQTQDAGALNLTKGEAADLISRLKHLQMVCLRALWIGLFYTMLTVTTCCSQASTATHSAPAALEPFGAGQSADLSLEATKATKARRSSLSEGSRTLRSGSIKPKAVDANHWLPSLVPI